MSKTYQVWHGHSESRHAYLAEGVQSPFPTGFTHVANVKANGLREAVELTTNTGGELLSQRWADNTGVEVLVEVPRSTGAGDVIVEADGKAYMVLTGAFREVVSAYEQSLQEVVRRGVGQENVKDGPER